MSFYEDDSDSTFDSHFDDIDERESDSDDLDFEDSEDHVQYDDVEDESEDDPEEDEDEEGDLLSWPSEKDDEDADDGNFYYHVSYSSSYS